VQERIGARDKPIGGKKMNIEYWGIRYSFIDEEGDLIFVDVLAKHVGGTFEKLTWRGLWEPLGYQPAAIEDPEEDDPYRVTGEPDFVAFRRNDAIVQLRLAIKRLETVLKRVTADKFHECLRDHNEILNYISSIPSR
jgi:hypothetical protein